jgi:hypothetical protein
MGGGVVKRDRRSSAPDPRHVRPAQPGKRRLIRRPVGADEVIALGGG